ncbi:MAG: 3-deoxy-D-manno-octulosonic acid transferase [Alphaproteobacteria bacterium]|nr:3-deoxy-D-manno-octulosonic acid transferase [Alphaproteobacteria bacterium]
MILSIYRFISYLAYPFVRVLLFVRKKKGKEDAVRGRERMGYYTKERPEGRLIWLHGASVGECLSMMPLVNYLVTLENTQVMVTSGTVTSANLMEKRLPKGAFHQYVPVDLPMYTTRFIKHFHPDLAFFFESDFWPNMLMDAHKAGIPMILLNGRISDKSFKAWQKALFFIQPLLNLFTFGLGQTREDAYRMEKLGFKKTDCVGNIKFAAIPAPYSEDEVKNLRAQIGARFVWLAGSTHDDEEMQAAEIHQKLAAKYSNLLTIIVPRHPERCDDLEQKMKALGLSVHRRSRNEDMNADIFLGDTIGEMGLFYRLSDFVFVGGSLVEFGGQNMLEPMRIGACTIIGPYAFNFKEIVQRAKDAGALLVVKDKDDLARALDELQTCPEEVKSMCQIGRTFANSETAVLQRVIDVLTPYLERKNETA